MKLDSINIEDTIAQARKMLGSEKGLSTQFKVLISLILSILELLAPKLIKANSKNSSLPPSQDPNREKTPAEKTGRKPGGQLGRVMKKLEQFDEPDEIIPVTVDRTKLPKGRTYKVSRMIKRQVVEINILRHIKEYQLEVLIDENGKEYIAQTPTGASQPIQYGNSVKAMSVYLSTYQMIPCARVEDFFTTQAGIPISPGSICNFNKEAYEKLAPFEVLAKAKLINAKVVHADETGTNINGKLHWLHNASNDKWTLIKPHKNRGREATDEIGILPNFNGMLVHDGWPMYFGYNCKHVLCNAHHLRELTGAAEQSPSHTWALQLKDWLVEVNKKVDDGGGDLTFGQYRVLRKEYLGILEIGEQECPPPPEPKEGEAKKRGRIKRSKERNLLERLLKYKRETLRFILINYVPFTNNQGERDLRMSKVQQKISGCFKSLETAEIACRARSFILTCQKQHINPAQALTQTFQGSTPPFK